MNQQVQDRQTEARLTLRLPSWLKKTIHHEAIEAGVSMSELICFHLEKTFKENNDEG